MVIEKNWMPIPPVNYPVWRKNEVETDRDAISILRVNPLTAGTEYICFNP